MKHKLEVNSSGYLKQRESDSLEFKQSFQYGDSLLEYLRILVSMANNKGGEIFFGVQDKPRIPIGLSNEKFENCDPTIITHTLNEYFAPEIHWYMNGFEKFGMSFGIFGVLEAETKPVICKKTKNNIVREAAIYYRYGGMTGEIRLEELSLIISKEKDKVNTQWMDLLKKIGKIGASNLHLIDSFKGEIHSGDTKIIMDRKISDNLNIIKKGQFTESGGEPVYSLVGEITTGPDLNLMVNPDSIYSILGKDIRKRLSINQYQLRALIWKLNIKGDRNYHLEIHIGANVVHKYTPRLIDLIGNELARDPDWIQVTTEEYKLFNKQNKPSKVSS